MNRKALYESLPFLENLDKKRRDEFEQYFNHAPMCVFESLKIKEYDKGEIIVREKEPVTSIYFIAKGIVETIDYRVHGISYEFQWFDKPYALGGMLLVDRYKRYASDGILRIEGSQQELSNSTGLCVRTIGRAIKQMISEDLITKNGVSFYITEEQYEKMEQKVNEIIEIDWLKE